MHRRFQDPEALFTDGEIHRGGAPADGGEPAGILLSAVPVYQGDHQRGAGAAVQQLQGAVGDELMVEEIGFPLRIRPPSLKFIAFGDENATIFQGLQRREETLALIGVE